MLAPSSAVSPSSSSLFQLPSGNTAINCAPDRSLPPRQSRRYRSMVRSDGRGYGLHPAKSFEILGVFDFVLCYGYQDLECIIGVVMLGEGKRRLLDHRPHIYENNDTRLIIYLGNRAVINSSNGGFLRKVAKFTCGCLFIPYDSTVLNLGSTRGAQE